MTISFVIFFVGILIFLAHLFAGIFDRTKIPDVLLLIIIGLCFGPLFGIVTPSDFGAVGPVFATVALVIILFEGGIGLHLDILQRAFRGAVALTLGSFLATMLIVGIAGLFLTDLGLNRTFMLGAIVGGTSSAVVVPLIRQLKMENESRTILFLESALTDVLCIVVAIALLEAYQLGELRLGLMAGKMIASFLLAALLGTIGALAWSMFLKKFRAVQNAIFTTPAFVFIIYGLVELLGYNGAIAALAFGIILGNVERFRFPILEKYLSLESIGLIETEKVFFSEVVFLLKTFFFLYIGLSIRLTDVWLVSVGFILILLIFVLRIPVIRWAVQKTTPATDASLMAVIAPKGLAAAVLASIPLQAGVPGGELIQDITYAVILFSILMTSLLVVLLDRTRLSNIYGSVFSGFALPAAPQAEGQRSPVEDPVDVKG